MLKKFSHQIFKKRFFFCVFIFIILIYVSFICLYKLHNKQYTIDDSFKTHSKAVIYPHFSQKYPPKISPNFVIKKAPKCNGKDFMFKKIEEIHEFLTQSDYPLKQLPIAQKFEKWFSNENIQKILKFRMNKKLSIKLAIIIPIRDRCFQLSVLLPYLHYFLQDFQDDYRIFVIEQSNYDPKVFNKGAIMNFGYKLAQKESENYGTKYDYLIFHDVDTLVLNPMNSFTYFPYALHRGVYRNNNMNERTKYFLPNEEYFGAIVQIPMNVFEGVNGFPNFFGWGSEDDVMRRRIQLYYSESEHVSILNSNSKGNVTFNMFGKIKRVVKDYSKVWQFPESTERYFFINETSNWKNFQYFSSNRKHFYDLSKWMKYYIPFAKLIVQSDGLNSIVSYNGHLRCIINDFHIDKFVSFYSLSINFGIKEVNERRNSVKKIHFITYWIASANYFIETKIPIQIKFILRIGRDLVVNYLRYIFENVYVMVIVGGLCVALCVCLNFLCACLFDGVSSITLLYWFNFVNKKRTLNSLIKIKY